MYVFLLGAGLVPVARLNLVEVHATGNVLTHLVTTIPIGSFVAIEVLRRFLEADIQRPNQLDGLFDKSQK